MGNAASTIPDKLSAEDAATFAGDRFDQTRFDELKDAEGFVTKEQFIAADGPLGPTKAGEGAKLPTKEEAEADAQADMAAAEAVSELLSTVLCPYYMLCAVAH